MSSRGLYQIDGNTLGEVVTQLNFLLQQIADRLDKLEGIRGKTDFVGSGLEITGEVIVQDSDEETIHSME